jgi:exodeoxyribonuclease V gamma subunit
LNCEAKKGYPLQSILIGTDEQWAYPPIAEPWKWLQRLLDYFWEGLSEPLPFFSESSFEYAARITKGKSLREALAGAHQKWEKQEFGDKGGESEDAYHHLIFGKVREPLDERFSTVALGIFGPLLQHQQPLGIR